MRVLMQPRPAIFRYSGGDTTQVLETADALKALGLSVDISLKVTENLSDYDIIHLFTTGPVGIIWTYPRFQLARIAKKPVVVSTIYWPSKSGEGFINWAAQPKNQRRGSLSELRRAFPPWLKPVWLKYSLQWLKTGRKPYLPYDAFRALTKQPTGEQEIEKIQKQVWSSADVLLPNSEAEAQVIQRAVESPIRYLVVPNAVNVSLFEKASADDFVKKYGIKDFVLCAATLTPRKNQLRLVRAVRNLPLVLIGETTRPYAKPYIEECKREAASNVIILGAMNQKEVASAYAAAKVHVLASYYETPGLSNLEAAIAGCNIVSTTGGCTKEYFGDFAWYCDPEDTQSIREAVQGAYESPYREKLAECIRNRFTWQRTAEATLEGYELALQTHNQRNSKADDSDRREK